MTNANRFRPLAEALEGHSAEGIALLTSEPWRFTQALVLTMVTNANGSNSPTRKRCCNARLRH